MKTRSRTLMVLAAVGAGFFTFPVPAQPEHGHAPAAKASAQPTAKQANPKPEATKPAPKTQTITVGETAAPKAGTPATHESPAAPASAHESAGAPSAEAVLAMLREGNAHWASGKCENPSTDSSRRQETAAGQHPFATIITCADSRLPVERIFDRGVGELFVVRVAGNVAGESETGTAEYAVEHLKTPVILVMGHTRCGAVAAAASGAELHGSLGRMVARINRRWIGRGRRMRGRMRRPWRPTRCGRTCGRRCSTC
ncbi:Carbonic anhydrase 2 [Phycisphaerales bacterium]|nr:Carbonic anhydrase 2 [Phycisphaerales bacterium]